MTKIEIFVYTFQTISIFIKEYQSNNLNKNHEIKLWKMLLNNSGSGIDLCKLENQGMLSWVEINFDDGRTTIEELSVGNLTYFEI